MGFLVTAEVHTELHFAEYAAAVTLAVNKALVEWGAIALEEIVRRETRVGDASESRKISPGVHLKDSFRMAVVPGHGGFNFAFPLVVVYSENPNAVWQELGTRASRRKKRKHPLPKGYYDNDPNRGVKPLYFMRKGLAAAEPQGIALIQKALRGVGAYGGGSSVFDTRPTHFVP